MLSEEERENLDDNPIICPKCREFRKLVFREKIFSLPRKSITYQLPYFRCDKCDEERDVIERKRFEKGVQEVLSESKAGNYKGFTKGEGKSFVGFGSCEFKYDARDWYFIPGLWRPFNEGSLTPVFFNRDLLLHYNSHPDYKVTMESFSKVSILKNGEPLILHGMGINRNGLFFAWLGDLFDEIYSLDDKQEYHRFRASNVDSDHDIMSDFYYNQIEVLWTQYDNELKVFKLLK